MIAPTARPTTEESRWNVHSCSAVPLLCSTILVLQARSCKNIRSKGPCTRNDTPFSPAAVQDGTEIVLVPLTSRSALAKRRPSINSGASPLLVCSCTTAVAAPPPCNNHFAAGGFLEHSLLFVGSKIMTHPQFESHVLSLLKRIYGYRHVV